MGITLSPWMMAFLVLMTGFAGFVDSAAGGGGLISLPAYLFAGLPPHYTYATNKFSAACGTTFATANFFKNGAMNLKVGILAAIGSFAGSALGAHIVLLLSDELLRTMMFLILPVAAVVILLLAANPKQELCLKWGAICRADGKMIGSILRIGVPNACENSFFQLGRLIVVSMIALFGTVQTSANAVANTLDSMGIIVGQAMGLAMVTVVGQCVGAGDPKQVRHYVKKLMLWSYLSMAVCNVLIIVFVEDLISLYSSLSPETVELTKTLVIIHESCAVALWSASFVLPNALRAANDVRFTMLVGIGSMIAFRILGSWILCVQMGWGAIGVWVAMILDWVCRTAFFVTRMISGKWQSKYIPS